MISYLAVFFLAFLISLLSTRRVMEWAKRRGWVDHPDFSRKLHKIPIPRIGGIGIFIAVILTLCCLYFLPTIIAAHFRHSLLDTVKLLSLSGMMMLIGFHDDLKSLKPWTKFSAQIVVAVAAWFMGYRILTSWSTEGTLLYLGMLSLPLTVLWIVGITNAFNLLDGMDGLSAGAALFATTVMLVPSFVLGPILSPVLLLALAGAIVGFLRFNFNPASIFLGDSGSFLLGSMLSLLAIEYSYKSATAYAIGIPIVALGLPVLDTLTVVLRRFLNGKPIFIADRRHIHHILVERGLKPRNAVILLYGVCGLFGVFSLLFLNPSGKGTGIVLVLLGSCILVGMHQLHCSEFKELLGYLLRGIRYQRRYLIGNVMAGKMIDGFHNALTVQDLLKSLSCFLEEMEFSSAEVRIPGQDEKDGTSHLKNWTANNDGPFHCLYRWTKAGTEATGGGIHSEPADKSADSRGLSTHFRLEFVYKIAGLENHPTLPFRDFPGSDVGRLTFYHPTTMHLPVSAVCLLSRQGWREFEDAINRIVAQSVATISDEEKIKSETAPGKTTLPAANRWRPFLWAAPIVHRMTGSHHRR
ncbi:MAG: undecaprenyl/decaprenyl-phosphate alpha-N-acetylglucosaminyl 1-phosphate transferase [Acidobacteria bacterium]|nr:undecaprenyl/decaprenyl-phosphate alpha-N-acetylglucosaminyl 1-phosphate transferase [Acidobacteriota bacterium]